MKKHSEKLSAVEFFEKLQQDKLETSSPFSITGMVKKTEGKEKNILFAPGGNCSNWVSIPLELIDDVELLSTVPCKDHSHPYVRLNLKAPKTAEAKMYTSLLQAVLSNLEIAEHAKTRTLNTDQFGDPICGPGTRKKCGPAVCPNPSGHGTIWCTKCSCEPIVSAPEFGSFYIY